MKVLRRHGLRRMLAAAMPPAPPDDGEISHRAGTHWVESWDNRHPVETIVVKAPNRHSPTTPAATALASRRCASSTWLTTFSANRGRATARRRSISATTMKTLPKTRMTVERPQGPGLTCSQRSFHILARQGCGAFRLSEEVPRQSSTTVMNEKRNPAITPPRSAAGVICEGVPLALAGLPRRLVDRFVIGLQDRHQTGDHHVGTREDGVSDTKPEDGSMRLSGGAI